MKPQLLAIAISMLTVACSQQVSNEKTTEQLALRKYIPEPILIGAAVNQWQVAGTCDKVESEVLANNFNCITPENCMKSEVIVPEKDKYDFSLADEFVNYGVQHNMVIIGHALIWHSQLAPWFCYDDAGNFVSADTLKQRMRNHIFTVMNRYKGKIHGYDVVNEAIEDDGSYRQSPFYNILGEEFIDYAFQCAQEADPNAELYYNDYSMNKVGKRNTVCELVKRLKSKGIRIDAVGLQSHMGLDFPNFEEFETSVAAFINAGTRVQFTEVDLSVLPNPYNLEGAAVESDFEYSLDKDPYRESVPDSVKTQWNERMAQFFGIVNKYAEHVNRVTFWGVTDEKSWKNDWPIRGRKDYALPFARDGKLKLN
ncbi:MAG: endo-1,4-beta-xylanase [Marinilabiliaceae bacterium]|nr:endo-1,4-beta-xylanase [Marinilabiliaceae bacterium]